MDDKVMTSLDYTEYLIETAMRNKDTDMLSLFRMIKAEFVKYMKDKQVEASLIDNVAIYNTMKKRLTEEIASLESAGRDTTIQHKHLDWIISQLPKAVTEEEIRLDLNSWLPGQSEANQKNIGFIMQHLKLVFHGYNLDMKMASQIVKEIINK